MLITGMKFLFVHTAVKNAMTNSFTVHGVENFFITVVYRKSVQHVG